MYWNCHSYFSFRYGTLSIADLFEEAIKNNVRKLILTDINNTSGYIELLRLCRERRSEYELEVALGIEFRKDDQLLYVGLAKNNDGFEELNRFLSHHNRTKKPLPQQAPELKDVFFVYPLSNLPDFLRTDDFIGVNTHELTRLIAPALRGKHDKMVTWHPVTFANKRGFNLHRLFRAIDQNTILSKLPASQQAHTSEIMKPLEELKADFLQYPKLVFNAERLLDECHIEFELGTDKNKKYFHSSKREDRNDLLEKALAGFELRYGDDNDGIATERFHRELQVIAKKNFEAYYLIAHDIVRFADHKGFAHVGRGSGANSIIAYCLGITDVDPIELDLYFERFLNTERTTPPDFDIDFSWKDRDEVTQYIFDRFDEQHVALLGTHSTFQGKAPIRELGKVMGLPKEEIDKIIKYPNERNDDDITRLIFQYAHMMRDIPNHLSVHAGGVLITEKPIYAYTAIDVPPKGFPVAHFEMHNAEDMGVFKFDILSQRGLGHIKDTRELIEKNRGISIRTDEFQKYKKDPKIRDLLTEGNCMGCFYVESPAMRMLLGKLGCEDYPTLVAASSIIRPGVARSGMMRAYIERHHIVKNGGNYESIHPKMEEIMHDTYGVMVYQEDVIKVAHHFAGITLTQADVLRRGMSGKYRSRKEFQAVKDQFFDNCRAFGYSEAVTNRVWFEIESFAGYSFAKGHSASYAVESYQSLFLKAHYPLEFMVGVINNFGGFYRTEFYFHEARMWGADIEAPCVNQSEYFTTIYDKSIYIGFIHLKDLEQKLGEFIVKERVTNGPYKNLDNFIRRVPVGLEQIRILIRIGAFRFMGKSKKELLWQVQLYFGKRTNKQIIGNDLFDEEPEEYELPPLLNQPFEDAFDEIELLGFPLCDPFLLLKDKDPGDTFSKQLRSKIGQRVNMVGYLVTTKDTSTKNGDRMHFGTFYDQKGEVFDTVNFPPVAKKYPFRGSGFYRVIGKVVEDFGYPMIEVDAMFRLPMIEKYPEESLKHPKTISSSSQ